VDILSPKQSVLPSSVKDLNRNPVHVDQNCHNTNTNTMAKVNTAPIKWAQRSDSLYITIALPGELSLCFDTSLLSAVLAVCILDGMIRRSAVVCGNRMRRIRQASSSSIDTISPDLASILLPNTLTHTLAPTPLSHAIHHTLDVKDESINLENQTLKFKGKSEGKDYEVDIVFFKSVDAEGSTYKVLPRSVQMHVMKASKKDGDDDEEEEFWPRLLKDKALEKNQVKVDWDRYVDEDEEEEGFDTSAVSCCCTCRILLNYWSRDVCVLTFFLCNTLA
jgi:hypothetical protein